MGSDVDLAAACAHAVRWACDAGCIARQHFGAAAAQYKADHSLVTDVDLQIQAMILAGIRDCYPGHGVIAEEGPVNREDIGRPYCWVVDPLDGTRNYARGFPIFCISIGLLHAGMPVLGVVHEPLPDRTYQAVAGGGALLAGQRLPCRSDRWGGDLLIGIPTPKRRPLPPAIRDGWARSAVLRNTGSTALHLALVATGALDAAYGQEVKLWDIAAGAVLVREVGGSITRPDGSEIFPVTGAMDPRDDLAFLAACGTVHQQLLRTLGSNC